MNRDLVNHKAIIYCSLAVMTSVYLLQVYTLQLQASFVLNNYLEVVLISVLCGCVAYILLYGCVALLNKYKDSDVSSMELTLNTLKNEEIENSFDDIANNIHKIIVGYIKLPDFDSELVDEMGSKIIAMWKPASMGYAYGLLMIYFVSKNSDYQGSDKYLSYQNIVLQKITNYRNKLAKDFEDENLTNQELTTNATEMVDDMATMIHPDACKNQNELLDKLIDYLLLNINDGKKEISSEIKNYSIDILNELNNK